MFEKLYATKAFAALAARNFRIFIFGQSLSLVGTWMQRLAMSWLVLRLTGSGAGLGLIDLSNQAPILVTGFFAGALIDRSNIKKLLIVTQTLCMLQAFALAFLDLSGAIQYMQVLFLSLMLGVVSSIDLPARQSSVSRMLDHPRQLNSALTINSTIFNIARLIGPAIAGFMLQAVGEGICFLLNGISFMAVIFSLTKLKLKDIPVPAVRKSGWQSFKEGIAYAQDFRLLRLLLFSSAIYFFLCLPYTTLLPLFARNLYASNASVLGFFLGSVGFGAIIGVTFQATFVAVKKLHRQLVVSIALFGLGLGIFSLSHSVYLSCSSLVVLGFGMSSGSVGFNTLVQSIIDDDKRGRVMSIYTVGNVGIGPMGSLAAGVVSDFANGTTAGLLLAAGALLLAWNLRKMLKVYDRQILKIFRAKTLAEHVV